MAGKKGSKVIERKPVKVSSDNILTLNGQEYINVKGLEQRYAISPSLVYKRADEHNTPYLETGGSSGTKTKWYIDNGSDFKRVEPEQKAVNLEGNRYRLSSYRELIDEVKELKEMIQNLTEMLRFDEPSIKSAQPIKNGSSPEESIEASVLEG